MRDDDRRPLPHHRPQTRQNLFFRVGYRPRTVRRRGFRIPGSMIRALAIARSLFLSSGEGDCRAHRPSCRVPRRNLRHPCRAGRRPRRLPPRRPRSSPSAPKATFSAIVSENRNGSCGTYPIAPRKTANEIRRTSDTVNQYRAGRRVEQTRKQINERRLARPRRSHQRPASVPARPPPIRPPEPAGRCKRTTAHGTRRAPECRPVTPACRPGSTSRIAGSVSSTTSIRLKAAIPTLEHVGDPAKCDHRPGQHDQVGV